MIGVFDSGVGGLTVLRELRRAMPQADFVYFGDTRNAPYGPRPHYELVQLTVAAMRLLRAHGAMAIVSACNSVSATMALAEDGTFPLPSERLIEMVGPTVASLADVPGRILLCATEATVRSGIYQDGFALGGKKIETVAIPDLAGLIEHGADNSEVARTIRSALASHEGSYDVLLLGCTHYPLVRDAFRAAAGPSVTIFDPAGPVATAAALRFVDEARGQGVTRLLMSRESAVFRTFAEELLPGSGVAAEVVE